jgi:hypothetical protein
MLGQVRTPPSALPVTRPGAPPSRCAASGHAQGLQLGLGLGASGHAQGLQLGLGLGASGHAQGLRLLASPPPRLSSSSPLLLLASPPPRLPSSPPLLLSSPAAGGSAGSLPSRAPRHALALQVLKAVVAQYNAEQLITQRSEVSRTASARRIQASGGAPRLRQ